MAGFETKSMDSPDEARTFDHGKVENVTVGGVTFGRSTFEPGWRWSEAVKPLAKTDSCQFHHVGYVVSGRLHVRLDDGTEKELGPGDVAEIPAGHDAWVVGNETCVMVDVDESSKDYAKPA